MSNSHELITVALGGFGVLAATHWANGLSRYEIEESNSTFQELNRRTNSTMSNKALRAVFADQRHRSGVRDEFSVERVEGTLTAMEGDLMRQDVLQAFDDDQQAREELRRLRSAEREREAGGGASSGAATVLNRSQLVRRRQQQQLGRRQRHIDVVTSSSSDDGGDDNTNNFDTKRTRIGWPRRSATAVWARRTLYADEDDEEEEEEEEHEADSNNNQQGQQGETEAEAAAAAAAQEEVGATDSISRAMVARAHRPPKLSHEPWWRHLTAPHQPDLDRVVSFLDLPSATDTGGWSQLRSFSFGAHSSAVHTQLDEGASASASSSFVNNLRKEIEACDYLQGVQLFCDSDSCFGGVTNHVATAVLGDEFGVHANRRFVLSCFPDPGEREIAKAIAAAERNENAINSDDPNALYPSHNALPHTIELLHEDHRNLNRGLATSLLSSACNGYVAHEIVSWQSLFAGDGDDENQQPSASSSLRRRQLLPGLDTTDDVATAAIVASWADSIMIPARGVCALNDDAVMIAESVSGSGAGGNLLLPDILQLWRPSSSHRVTAAYHALPLLLGDPANSNEESLQFRQLQASMMQQHQRSGAGGDPQAVLLYNILAASAPLADYRQSFRPLSGVAVDSSLVGARSSQVLSHHYVLRGALPFSPSSSSGTGGDAAGAAGASAGSAHAMRQAMTEYTAQLRCPIYAGFSLREPAPLSGTFPRRVFLADGPAKPTLSSVTATAAVATQESSATASAGGVSGLPEAAIQAQISQQERAYQQHVQRVAGLRAVTCGSHALNTNAAAPYLNQVYSAAMRRNMRLRGDAAKLEMGCDVDTWRELEEDLAALRDNYDYQEQHADSDEDY